MSASTKWSGGVDVYAEIGSIAAGVRGAIARILPLLAVLGAVEAGVLWFSAHPGTVCFVLTLLSSLFALSVWKSYGVGLPIIPLLAVQNLLAYGLPVVVSNVTVMVYPEQYMTRAGIEVMVFTLAMLAAWRFGVLAIGESSRLCYALQGFEESQLGRLTRLGFGLMAASTLFQLLQSFGVLDIVLELLPSGSFSILYAVAAGAGACGFFLGAMLIGKAAVGALARVLFWLMLFLNCYIAASAFLLSSTATTVFSVLIGLFWGSGRVPWRFLAIILSVLSFLNLGKFEMRERYWALSGQDYSVQFTFSETPIHYGEWVAASYAALTGEESEARLRAKRASQSTAEGAAASQSMLDRINNLQNLLFVIDAMDRVQIPTLNGATYALIPPLLVPRVIWPDKPRSHQGQVMLNVHFGRQDLNSTFQTYVAWGLQAEAYGNFGPVMGTLILGAAVGLLFAWVEKYTARKLLLSMEGFLAFTLFLAMANSYEMVSSVLVTSVFQAFVPVVIASLPFVERILPNRENIRGSTA